MNSRKVYPSSNFGEKTHPSALNNDKTSKIVMILGDYFSIWQALRAIFAIICVLWFGYSAINIIHQYRQYNTILLLEYDAPNRTDLPAFTICGPFIMSRDVLEKVCSGNYANVTVVAREELEQCAINRLTASNIFDNYSISVDSLIKSCWFMPDTTKKNISEIINCEQISPIVSSVYEGRKCFTFLSQLNNTDADYVPTQMVYETHPQIQILIGVKNKMLMNTVGSIQKEHIIGALHSPNIIPTHLDLNYFRIFSDSTFVLRFTKKFEFLLPPPYKTNCRQYEKSNEKGEKSRGDCLNTCIKRETYHSNHCAIFYGILTPDLFSPTERICNKTHQNYMSFVVARKKCMKYCQSTCVEQTYDVITEEQYDPTMSLGGDTLIKIKSGTTPYTLMYHQEEWSREAFIGTLGGYGHIVLGLSAIKLFNLIVRFISRFNCNRFK